MQALRLNSRFLLFARFSRTPNSDFQALRKYSRLIGNSTRPGCFCVQNGSREYNRRLLSLKFDPLLSQAAAISLFSRSTQPASPPVDPTAPTLPFPLEEIGPIPEPPPIPSADALRDLQISIGDNMREIGLASYGTPVGWVQNGLDLLHATTGLPWWEVIILSTVIVRAVTLPIMIFSQRQSGLMALHKEKMDVLMNKADEAKRSGDAFEHASAMMEVRTYMNEKGVPGMTKMFLPLLINGSVFMSYFLALRGMANASLWSLHNEGTLWFPDLTITDPMYILPVVCTVTLLAMVEFGVEFGSGGSTMKPGMRWVTRLMPLSILVLGKFMPTAVLVYWATSNSISILISLAFRIPKIRAMLKIAPIPKRATSWREKFAAPEFIKLLFFNPRGVWHGIKNFRKERKKTAPAPTAAQLRKMDARRFKQAGEGAIPPTFTFDPKTKYTEVFQQKNFFKQMKEKIFGGKKKSAVPAKRRATG